MRSARRWRPAFRVLAVGTLSAAVALLALTSASVVCAQVQTEELPQATPTPAPAPAAIAPGAAAAANPGAAGGIADAKALEAAAEEKYSGGDLAGAAILYRQLAVGTSEPRERMRLLVAAAWLEQQLGHGDEASQLLAQGLADAPDFPFQPQNYSQDFVDLFLRAREHALAERKQRAGELVRRSLQEIATDDLTRARATLVQALALAPDDAFGLYNLALVDMKAGRKDNALAGFERLLALESAHPGSVPVEVRSSALSSLGLLYYEKDFLEDSRRNLQAATVLDPASARSWNNLGLTLRKAGDIAGAEQAFRKALELTPEDAQLANNLALLMIGSQRWNDAIALLTQTTARVPNDPLGWLNLAIAQRGTGDRSAAAASLARAIALDADNHLGVAARSASYLAIVRYEQQDAPGSAAAAHQALGWRSDDVEAWVYLGLAQQAQHDLNGARDSLQHAAALAPARPEIHNNLGTVLVAMNDLAGAEASFRQALAIRPGFAEAQANLDQVLARQLAAKVGAPAASDTRPAPPPSGRPRRTPKYLGVRFSDTDFTYLGIKGAVVDSVAGETPAARAGLRKGDVVLGVDGKPVEGPQALLRYLRNLSGERDYVEMDILRDGQPRRLRVEMF